MVKEMGYLKEMIGLASRQRRCAAAWQGHLNHSRAWIIRAMEICERPGRVVVLGSGLLNDVPLADLSAGFRDVVLVDMLHMPSVVRAARAFPNVRLEERDVSGFVEPLYRHLAEGEARVPLPVPDLCADGADLVVSLNLVSQLPVLPAEFAERKNKKLGDDLLGRLVSEHLRALAALPCSVCLISETEHRLCHDGDVLERADPLLGAVIPEALKKRSTGWDWHYAPHPERHPDYDLVYGVEGYIR